MNGNFYFEFPPVLFAFLLFVPVVLFDIFSRTGKRNRRLPPVLQRHILISNVFFKIFIACLIIALANPHWGTSRRKSIYRRGLDVVIAIDVSRSMEIVDVPSFGTDGEISRLERGLAIAQKAVSAMPGARFAAAVGRNRGMVTVPLTWDNEAILNFLESVDGSSMTGAGTNLEALTDAAISAFQNSFPAQRLVVLVSDGESLSGSLKAASGRCAENEIMVIPLVVGSDTGSPVPGEKGVISRRDFVPMRMIANRTGGILIDGNGEDAAARLVSCLGNIFFDNESGSGQGESKARWYLFVIAAIIAYGVSRCSRFALKGLK
jgi:Ca-activated chloride channel family protein